MEVIYYQDPGHGWLEVPAGMLAGLGIAHQISSYSYQRGDKVYLEEDDDATKFRLACQARGIPLTFKERHSNSDSFIRSLPDYVAPAAPAAKPLFTTLAANCIAQQQASLFEPDPGEFALA